MGGLTAVPHCFHHVSDVLFLAVFALCLVVLTEHLFQRDRGRFYGFQFKQVVHRVSVHKEVADVIDGKGQVLVAAVVGGGTVFQPVAPRIGWDGCFEVCFKLLAGVHALSFGRFGSGIQNGILSGNDSARVIFTIPACSVLLYQTKMFPIESPSHL